MTENKNLRKIALDLLLEYENQGKYVNLSLSSHKTDGLSQEERSLLTAILYTSVERKLRYDYYVAAISARPLDKFDITTRCILRLGLCQLLDMDAIPAFAAVNETVKLARNKGERSFVNFVMREADRRRDSLPLPDRNKNLSKYLSVAYSFPLWIVKRFISVFGEDRAEKILAGFSEIPTTDLRVNTAVVSTDELLSKLLEMGLSVSNSPYSPDSLRIEGSVDPRKLPYYNEGGFIVQDAACSAAIYALSAMPGDKIADVCACPGGKSFAAAMAMKNEGEIHSFDIHESKLSLIESGAERLGIDIITTEERDARYPDEALLESLDRVICDVPCSGLGVLSKKPDLRYKSEEGICELPSLQYEILSASAKYLKVGGRLIYSTCTILPEENEAVVERFIKENPGYRTVDFNIGEFDSKNGSFTFIPCDHKTDGFFLSLIEREI